MTRDSSMPTLPILPDAEVLYQGLLARVREQLAEQGRAGAALTHLVGIYSGGAWLAERLHEDLQLPGQCSFLSSSLHRDDYEISGLHPGGNRTRLHFQVQGARILLLDDVLHTGRTVRAAINELFDFGRPQNIELAVLLDRAGRQLPIEPGLCMMRVEVPQDQSLALFRQSDGRFGLRLEKARRDKLEAGTSATPHDGAPTEQPN